MTTHHIPVQYNSDRVTRFSYKSRNAVTTIGWRSYCSCGFVVETKGNSPKTHFAKVEKHRNLVEAK
jgi:hypothetical protein